MRACFLQGLDISTHTLTWSVTDRSYVSHFSDWISTHTLTWSVTHGTGLQARRADNFNSHAHVERDVSANHVCWAEKNFNSHAHVERDELPVESYLKYQDFNSHAHVERDENSVVAFQPICISTHTLTWSVTSYKTGELSENIFQLTRSRGA